MVCPWCSITRYENVNDTPVQYVDNLSPPSRSGWPWIITTKQAKYEDFFAGVAIIASLVVIPTLIYLRLQHVI